MINDVTSRKISFCLNILKYIYIYSMYHAIMIVKYVQYAYLLLNSIVIESNIYSK